MLFLSIVDFSFALNKFTSMSYDTGGNMSLQIQVEQVSDHVTDDKII